MNYLNKIEENLTSIKFWVFSVATWMLLIGKISEYIWGGIAGALIGGRVFEYFTNRKNGNNINQ